MVTAFTALALNVYGSNFSTWCSINDWNILVLLSAGWQWAACWVALVKMTFLCWKVQRQLRTQQRYGEMPIRRASMIQQRDQQQRQSAVVSDQPGSSQERDFWRGLEGQAPVQSESTTANYNTLEGNSQHESNRLRKSRSTRRPSTITSSINSSNTMQFIATQVAIFLDLSHDRILKYIYCYLLLFEQSGWNRTPMGVSLRNCDISSTGVLELLNLFSSPLI